MRIHVVILGLIFTNCCGPPEITFNPADISNPEGTDILLSIVKERCEDLSGTVTWVAEKFECAFYEDKCSGVISIGGCGFETTVVWRENVTWTALAHELGHACLKTADEERAEAFSLEVNLEVIRQMNLR